MTTQERPDLDWRPRARAYADTLGAGTGLDPAWRAIFASVPRHVFVPRFWALDGYNSPQTEIIGADPEHRATWLEAVYSDQVLVTQWTLGPWRDRTVRVVTSSASEPGVVATMLDRLAVEAHHTVLEIGTGTGYNAALLCARVGDHRVTSIDIDSTIVEAARGTLAEAGYRPELHAGDGALPLPGNRRFDRIVVTCAAQRIPMAWIAQLAPGGRLVVPLGWGGALAVLDKIDDTEVTGRIDQAEVRFMTMRSAAGGPMPARTAPEMPGTAPWLAHRGVTDVDPAVLDDAAFRLWLALHRPDLLVTQGWNDGDPVASVIYNQHERASADRIGAGVELWPVRQQGGRPWDSVETAWRSYERTGRPDRERLGLTARTNDDQHVWLDEPTGPYTWPLPDA